MSLFGELSRRNVFRVAAAYLVFGWLVLQIADVVFPALHLPEWSVTLVTVLLAIGFVPVLVFSWIYELTPEGVKKESEIDRTHSITSHTGRKLDLFTLAVLAVVVVFVALQRPPASPEPSGAGSGGSASVEAPVVSPASDAAAPDGIASVAVLPFVNMSDDPGNEYFSDGISEELLNVLVKIQGLRVPSRTSSFAFKGQTRSISEIARELGVDHVLEGSVRKAGDQVRVTAQLIDARTDAHLWSSTYTRTLDDIFAIQDEIAHAIVDALKITLGTGRDLVTVSTDDSDAYNHYLKGRFFWHQRTRASFESAERELRRAVDIDPGYSDAWAALGDVYVLQPEYRFGSMEEAIPKARAALERALAINAESARALTTRAYLRYLYEWDYPAAEADFLEAIAIDPGYATAHQWYAEFLAAMRRFDEALAPGQRALALDPLAPVIPLVLGNFHRFQGQFEEADRYYEMVQDVAPDWFNTLANQRTSRVLQGRYEEALAFNRRVFEVLGFDPDRGGDVELAIRALMGEVPMEEAVQAIRNSSTVWCAAVGIPWWLAVLGAYDDAIEMAEHCIEAGDPYATALNYMVPFEPMRGMPRFQALLARINLPVEDAQ